jgi:hypothetical protein
MMVNEWEEKEGKGKRDKTTIKRKEGKKIQRRSPAKLFKPLSVPPLFTISNPATKKC